MRRITNRTTRRGVLLALWACAAVNVADAYTLWSASGVPGGPGQLLWPGGRQGVPLTDLTLRHLAYVANEAFRVTFSNNAGVEPNICGDLGESPTGKLSDGKPINENFDACALEIGGRRVLLSVARSAKGIGEPTAFFDDDGELVLAAEFSLDFGSGQVIDLPLLSTTGAVVVPHPAAATASKGNPAYGSQVAGRLGDADGDGWIDGTLVAVGVMPANAPVAAGETFVLYRNFQMDMPVSGVLSGNVRGMVDKK